MVKPVVLTVNDDPEVLRAIEGDLKREYSDRFRVLAADSGSSALETLKQLKQHLDLVALFMVEEKMTGMTGIEFLEQAKEIFPDAKCVLLTDVDTDADIRAIKTTVNIDCYLLKLSDPPEERVYPVLYDLLDDWHNSSRSPFDGIRVIGHRWSPQSYQIKDFLARNQRPFRWLDIETHKEAKRLVERVKSEQPDRLDGPQLPLVLFSDGSYLEAPTDAQIAEKIGLLTHSTMPFYDLVIVGGGPAGLAAAVYGGSEVYIVGGANSAGQAAMYFSQYARAVTMLVRGDSLSKNMSQYLVEQIQATDNITVQLHSSVVEVKGDTRLEAITIANSKTGAVQTVSATALFIFIGAVPHTEWLAGMVEREEHGFILAGPELVRHGLPEGWTLERDPFIFETSVPGIFVVGDVRSDSVRRVASAVGQGSVAVQLIHQYLAGKV